MNKDEKKTLNIKKTLDLAIKNHQKNNLKTAEQLYNQIIEFEPDHVESIFLLGSLSIQTKNFDRARQLLNKVIQINPNHAKAHNNLGATFQELKKNQEAINCYEKAIEINPKLPDTYCNLSLLYMNSGKHDEALQYCNRALNLIPQMLKAVNLKSEILKKNTPHWHTQIINDKDRNNFYLSALKSVIKTSSSVFEIGTGSGLLSIISAALSVNSSLLLIYSDVPSIGSINQKVFKFSFNLFAEVSSEMIVTPGVISLIFLVKILLTSISPLVTGVLSGLISLINPFFLNSNDISPAFKKVSTKPSIIFLLSCNFILHIFLIEYFLS